MSFWMACSTLLDLVVLLPFQLLSHPARQVAVIAFCIQLVAVVFSLVFPVPINNRSMNWTPETPPADWKQQEHRWTFTICRERSRSSQLSQYWRLSTKVRFPLRNARNE
jgi:hypothetical protein